MQPGDPERERVGRGVCGMSFLVYKVLFLLLVVRIVESRVEYSFNVFDNDGLGTLPLIVCVLRSTSLWRSSRWGNSAVLVSEL